MEHTGTGVKNGRINEAHEITQPDCKGMESGERGTVLSSRSKAGNLLGR